MAPTKLSERLRDVVAPRAGSNTRVQVGDVARGPAGPPEHGLRRPLEETLGGEWRSLESGRYFLVERRASADAWHGSIQIGDLAARLARSAAATAVLANAARPPFLFFDLETTGLNGGAGTYAFLVGLGLFDEDGSFVTRQYLMARASDERPMLQAVSKQLSASGALVSFNGKTFDGPLLETRFLFHRLTWSGATIAHVDVLHPARRFWRTDEAEPGPSTCSLPVLERQVLGALRQDDVPGMEAPARYFQFVRSGDSQPLSGVLDHNRLDLLSLAGLTGRLLELVSVGAQEARTSREAFALGGLYARAGWPARAHGAFDRALELLSADEGVHVGAELPVRGMVWLAGRGRTTTTSRLRVDVLRALAKSARRAARYDEAARRWREVLECPGCSSEVAREAAEALAIHHEHRRRDLESARSFTLRTLQMTPSAVRHASIRHRLARLERKLSVKPTLLLGE